MNHQQSPGHQPPSGPPPYGGQPGGPGYGPPQPGGPYGQPPGSYPAPPAQGRPGPGNPYGQPPVQNQPPGQFSGHPGPGQPYNHPQGDFQGPPHGQPPYGQPRKKKTGLIVGGLSAVVVLALVAVALFVWPGFISGGSSEPASPTETVTAFMDKVTSGDCQGAASYVAPPAVQDFRESCDGNSELAKASMASPTEKITGNTAAVTAQVTYGGQTESTQFNLRKFGEEWKILGIE